MRLMSTSDLPITISCEVSQGVLQTIAVGRHIKLTNNYFT